MSGGNSDQTFFQMPRHGTSTTARLCRKYITVPNMVASFPCVCFRYLQRAGNPVHAYELCPGRHCLHRHEQVSSSLAVICSAVGAGGAPWRPRRSATRQVFTRAASSAMDMAQRRDSDAGIVSTRSAGQHLHAVATRLLRGCRIVHRSHRATCCWKFKFKTFSAREGMAMFVTHVSRQELHSAAPLPHPYPSPSPSPSAPRRLPTSCFEPVSLAFPLCFA